MRCHWPLDDVLPAKGKHVVEGKVFAPQWERAGGGHGTGLVRLEKGRRRAAWRREKKKGRRGVKAPYNHRDSKGMVILYTEISFCTAVRELFPSRKAAIFL